MVLAVVLVAALAVPAAVAHASLGFESTEFSIYSAPRPEAEPGSVGPPQLQAGSHPYEARFSFAFNQTTDSEGQPVPDEAAKDLEVDLPAGLIGNPLAVPQCLREEFESGSLFSEKGCPAGTQIGTLRLDTTLAHFTLPVFNLEPPPGETAQFGVFVLLTPMVMTASVRSDDDYGLRMTLHNLPQFLPLVGGSLNLWGVPADSGHDTLRGKCLGLEGQSLGKCPAGVPRRPFLTLPVRCGEPPVARFRMDSWENPGEFVSGVAAPLDAEGHELALEGCDSLDFSPEIDIRPESSAADAPSALGIDLRLPQSENPDGLGEGEPSSVVLDLPPGLSLNPAAGDGLGACSPEQIALKSVAPPTCPDSSRIGSVTMASPLTAEPLRGAIYLATPGRNPFGSMFAAYLVAEGDGILAKVPGRIDADGGDGQLTMRLEDLPQLPFSDFSLRFDGGPRAPLALPAHCGTFTASARVTAYSAGEGAEPSVLPSSFAVDRNCGGGFSPAFLSGATSSLAGRRAGLKLRLSRAEGEEGISRFSVTLPRGLVPLLGDLPRCPEPLAREGNCLPASRIGSVDVAAGAGSHPFHLQGPVFLTGPYKGAPFGLAIAIPAAIGPYDLGIIVVRAKALVDPRSARLTISTDGLPRVVQGIPLRVQSLELTTAEKPGTFALPTSCDEQEIGGRAVGETGDSAPLSTPFFLGGCGKLGFSPQVSASTEGSASRRGGAALRLAIRNRLGDRSNLRSVTIGFPPQLSPRLSAIQGACPAAAFAAGPEHCPSTSAVGTARIRSPIFATALEGSAYLVSRGREALPRIVLVMGAEGATLELFGSLHLSRKGTTSVTFAGMPDAPISSFALVLPRGRHSALGANFLRGAGGALCGRGMKMAVELSAHNRARVKRVVRVGCGGL
ncbi:MAG: hypothetical protein ACTHO8_11340 [Solirubrobacterales bacterium]